MSRVSVSKCPYRTLYYEDKRFKLVGMYTTKTEAENFAKNQRKLGNQARVVSRTYEENGKVKKGWGVYTRKMK